MHQKGAVEHYYDIDSFQFYNRSSVSQTVGHNGEQDKHDLSIL